MCHKSRLEGSNFQVSDIEIHFPRHACVDTSIAAIHPSLNNTRIQTRPLIAKENHAIAEIDDTIALATLSIANRFMRSANVASMISLYGVRGRY